MGVSDVLSPAPQEGCLTTGNITTRGSHYLIFGDKMAAPPPPTLRSLSPGRPAKIGQAGKGGPWVSVVCQKDTVGRELGRHVGYGDYDNIVDIA
jgi:hypothetical protein